MSILKGGEDDDSYNAAFLGADLELDSSYEVLRESIFIQYFNESNFIFTNPILTLLI